LTVSAASDLTAAFGEIGREFAVETGQRVIFNFGSTGQLAQQISQGAPVDLFAAASLSYIDELERAGLVVPGTKQVFGRGRIVLWQRGDSPLVIERIADLARPEVRRVAIANPDHAPYGAAARAALRSAGVWEAVQPKLVLGENVRQALQYAETGNVDVAIVALSLSVPAAAPADAPGRFTLIPAELYPPLDQSLAVIRGAQAEAAARAFAAWVVSSRGQAILRKYGFTLDPEPAR
jgi:molybdate transport system substrate-binding protein